MNKLISLERRNEEYFLSGKLDRDTVPSFWQQRETWVPKDKKVVIDLSKLQRIDSAGMVMLLHFQHYMSQQDQEISFINLPEQLKMLMRLSKVDSLLKA